MDPIPMALKQHKKMEGGTNELCSLKARKKS